jgi:hypothetical protein
MKNDADADWETLLSSAAHVSRIVPDSIFADASGTEAEEVRRRFAAALADLERVAGWLPTPVGRMSIADGRFDGIETTIRDRARSGPLETTVEAGQWGQVEVPTLAEVLRIKAWLVISRNAARDYRDAAAIAERLGSEKSIFALATLDNLYPQSNGASARQQLLRQLSEPLPFDEIERSDPVPSSWNEWRYVVQRCRALAVDLLPGFERLTADDERCASAAP